MKLKTFAMLNAVLDRIGAFISDALLRALRTQIAEKEAADFAELEELSRHYLDQGNQAAAKHLERHLAAASADDSTAIGVDFGRSLLADDYSSPRLSGPQSGSRLIEDTSGVPKKRRGRPPKTPPADA